jgi:hypothetical protein
MKLEELDVKQLRSLAELHGLEVPKMANTTQILKLIEEANIVDPENVTPPPDSGEKASARAEGKDKFGDRLKVIFPNQDGPDSMPKISVTVNGYNWKIPREKVVMLPQECLDVIDNAIVEEYYRDTDGTYKKRSRRRFTYQVVRD